MTAQPALVGAPSRDLQAVLFRATEAPDLMAQAWRLRHTVFNDVLGWGIPARDMLEIDEFDLAAHHCVLLRGQTVIGYVRALPTTAPYLLSRHFPQLVDTPPAAPDTVEISRFAVHPRYGRVLPVQRRLVREGVVLAHGMGASRMIAVTEPPFARFLAACGLVIDEIAPPQVVGEGRDGSVEAMVIGCAVNSQSLAAMDVQTPSIAA